MPDVIHVTSETFDNIISQTPLVIVDFSADWCPPCRMMHPIYKQMAEKYGDKVTFLEVDGEASPDLTVRYSAMALPTFIFFREGEVVKRIVGARPSHKFEAEIQAFMQEMAPAL